MKQRQGILLWLSSFPVSFFLLGEASYKRLLHHLRRMVESIFVSQMQIYISLFLAFGKVEDEGSCHLHLSNHRRVLRYRQVEP